MADPQPQQEHRPYLSPEKGEHLQKKTVSAKAMSRLQVAADAIAATKGAIQNQGNQIAALQRTNMNSQYRLMVMRDPSCWEYTTSVSRQAAYENPEADIAAKADLAHGGNCGEHAWVAYHYLRQNAKGEHIQVSQKSGFDHAFVLIGDLKKDTDQDVAVSDPWPNHPTACLWEDHFAFCERSEILDHQSMVADGRSFKAAIAAGLKLSARGEQMVKMAASDAETADKVKNWKQNHFWNHDDTAMPTKYDYQVDKSQQAGAQQGQGQQPGAR
ncbi:MAG TPA: hypothetical protein VFQ53_01720 [Kofleriaceae bacterium]|nr:hypothetical protein [Kofleriaceae bacterium]